MKRMHKEEQYSKVIDSRSYYHNLNGKDNFFALQFSLKNLK